MSAERRFVERYGGVYEHSPWIAERAAPIAAGLADPERIAAILADCVDNASDEARLALIRAHPDLAVRAQVRDELTADSRREQSGAGLDACSPEEFAEFGSLNATYRQRFGFPFIMAVSGFDRRQILDAFRERVNNDPDEEFETAIREIHRIARLRIDALHAGSAPA